MSFPFPARTLSSTLAQHLDDHNTIAEMLVRTPFTTSSTRAEHLAEHNALHPDFALPQRALGDSATLHLADHDTMHANIIQTYAGNRGTPGPRSWTGYPGYPGSFNATVNQGPTSIQSAIAAQPTGATIRVTSGTYSITSEIQPKANQQLWFDQGATITNGASLLKAIHPTGVNGVKIMGATISGFTTTNGAGINPFNCANWEIAYNDISNCYWNIEVTAGGGLSTSNMWVHHNKSYSAGAGGVFTCQRIIDSTWEDNEWGPGPGNNKALGTTNFIFRYNWCHDTNRSGVWYDTATTNSLTEWNLIQGTGFTDPMGAICFEICRWQEGGTNNNGTEMVFATRNEVRHNHIVNNYNAGVFVRSSTWTEIYRNLFETNLINTGNPGEVDLTFDANLIDGSGNTFELANNHTHNNIITPRDTSKEAARIQLSNVADTAPYLTTNTKNNNWNFNRYDLVSASHTAFAWPFLTNKTFAQWQAVPQGPSGTGAFQDINGEII